MVFIVCLYILMCIHHMQTYADLYRCYCQFTLLASSEIPNQVQVLQRSHETGARPFGLSQVFFWGEYLCMEDPPKIAHMDLVWLCWSYGKPKRSETQKYVDANKNRWNHIDLRPVLMMFQLLCTEFIQVEYSLVIFLWEANDIQWHPTARISMIHAPSP